VIAGHRGVEATVVVRTAYSVVDAAKLDTVNAAGDAVLLTSVDAASAITLILNLFEACESDAWLPDLRIGRGRSRCRARGGRRSIQWIVPQVPPAGGSPSPATTRGAITLAHLLRKSGLAAYCLPDPSVRPPVQMNNRISGPTISANGRSNSSANPWVTNTMGARSTPKAIRTYADMW
jgi:hypothetical protein